MVARSVVCAFPCLLVGASFFSRPLCLGVQGLIKNGCHFKTAWQRLANGCVLTWVPLLVIPRNENGTDTHCAPRAQKDALIGTL